MEKIYAKNDLELLSRIQGAIDDDMFRHNVYFVLETLLQAEVEIRETATQNSVDPDFGPLDNYNINSEGFEGFDIGSSNTPTISWKYPVMPSNDESILSNGYMELILSGLNGGDLGQFDSTQGKGYLNEAWPSRCKACRNNQLKEALRTSVLEHYHEIFERTSELYDCAMADKVQSHQFLCDDRIPESAWSSCENWDLDCYINAMMQSTDGTGICTMPDEMESDNTDTSNQSMCACDL